MNDKYAQDTREARSSAPWSIRCANVDGGELSFGPETSDGYRYLGPS